MLSVEVDKVQCKFGSKSERDIQRNVPYRVAQMTTQKAAATGTAQELVVGEFEQV